MARTQARFAARVDLTLRAHKLPDSPGIFVIHDIAISSAEEALFFVAL